MRFKLVSRQVQQRRPKLRTTDIIDSLATEARGVFFSRIGCLSYNGAAGLNVAIGTVVVHGNDIPMGLGHAVVLNSNPDDEYEEMLRKARTGVWVFGRFGEGVKAL